MRNSSKLSVLYYPYSRCLNPDFLRRALLLFDELLFLDASEGDGEDPIRDGDRYYGLLGRHRATLEAAWDALREDYRFLINAGIVRVISVRRNDALANSVLSAAFYSDLSDRTFLSICEANSILGWLVPRKRLPRVVLENADTLGAALQPSLKTLLTKYKNDWFKRHDYFWGESSGGIIAGRMPFSVASALYLNQALIACEELGLVPITDSIIHHRLLLRKYERINETSSQLSFNGTFNLSVERLASDIQKRVIFSINLLNLFLPQEELSKRTIRDIVAYRDKCQDELTRLRTYVVKIVSTIEAEPWTVDFERRVKQIIDGEVLPEVENARENVRSIYEQMFGGVAKAVLPKAILGVTPTLTAALMTHLSLGQITALTATGLLTGIGLAVPEMIEGWRKKLEQRRNALTFLLNLSGTKPLVNRLSARRVLISADKTCALTEPGDQAAHSIGAIDERHSHAVTSRLVERVMQIAFDSNDPHTRLEGASFLVDLFRDCKTEREETLRAVWKARVKELDIEHLVRRLRSGLQEPEPSVNMAAIHLAEYLKIREIVPLIIAALPRLGYDWIDGLDAILNIGGPNAYEYLIAYVESGNRWRLQAIIMTLLACIEPIPLDTLITIVMNENERLLDRLYAAYAAVAQGDLQCRSFFLDQCINFSRTEKDELLLNLDTRRQKYRQEIEHLMAPCEPEREKLESEEERHWREELQESFKDYLAHLDSLARDLTAKFAS
jgi:hypothetical protein